MKNKIIHLTFASSLTDICEANSSFDKGVLRVAYTGKNRNKSYISKESFERALPSALNCPVVANYDVESDSIGGHDMGVVKDNSGNLRLINYTSPLGVIPESGSYWFDTVEEKDGSLHDYLCLDVLLWKRQPIYPKIKKDGIVAHSMEITVKAGHMEDDIYVIDDFEFTAFCLLGEDVTPCFESSSLAVFSMLKEEMSEMMQDLKDSLQVEASNDVNDIHPQKYSMEGGTKVLDEKMKLIAEYGIDLESIDFSIEELTIEELTEKFEAMKKADQEQFALTEQVVEEIRKQLCEAKVETSWGIEPQYCYMDCDFEANEVYAYDITDWLIYGFAYTKEGDTINIDFDSKKRKKIAIVDFDDAEQPSPVAPVFNRAEQVIKDNAEWEAKYNTASETIADMESELGELRQYKADVEAAADTAKREEVFAAFEDLNGNEAFEALRENNADLDIDTLEEKLFAIRGRIGVQAKFSVNENKAPKIKVIKDDDSAKPYGGVVEKYLGNKE